MILNESHCYWTPKSKPDELDRFICHLPIEVDLQVGDQLEIATSIEKNVISGIYGKVEFKIYNQNEQRFDYWVRPMTDKEYEKFNKSFLGDVSKLKNYS